MTSTPTSMSLTHHNNNNMNNSSNNKEEPIRKRTRATAEQLAILEDTFAVNVSPNGKLRKQLAEQLKMTDRSIQIWFQNRRAKVKHMQKRAQLQMHQANMRAQLYHYQQQHFYLQQQYAPHQRAHSLDSYKHHHHRHQRSTATSTPPYTIMEQQRQSVPPSLPYADIVDLNPDSWTVPQSSTTDPTHLAMCSSSMGLSISSLTIGQWHRLKMQPKDLTCFYQPEQQILCWNIIDGNHHFKMEMPATSIQQLNYSPSSAVPCETSSSSSLSSSSSSSASPITGELVLHLYCPPLFYMKHQHEWVACSDFTEHQQASQILQHTLKGIGLTLWQELSALMATCPETQHWIQLIGSPSSISSYASAKIEGDFSNPALFTNEMDLALGSDTFNQSLLVSSACSSSSSSPSSSSTSMSSLSSVSSSSLASSTIAVSLPSSEPHLLLASSPSSNMLKCDGSFSVMDNAAASTSTDDFLMDPSLLDPSLWSSTNGFLVS